jgi:hypothetical protein
VVEATRWGVVSGKECNARWGRGQWELVDQCRHPAVIYDRETTFSNGDVLCECHMGSHRWIVEGVVYQWKADPPWVYGPVRPKLPPRKR